MKVRQRRTLTSDATTLARARAILEGLVKKAVNLALRRVGKRNASLNGAAIAVCRRLMTRKGAARWVGADALRELTGDATVDRIRAGPATGR